MLPERFADGANLRHAVWLDGAIVSTGMAAPTEHGLLLYGGATAERARGRGAYRAPTARAGTTPCRSGRRP